jgi:hypothetical protein
MSDDMARKQDFLALLADNNKANILMSDDMAKEQDFLAVLTGKNKA